MSVKHLSFLLSVGLLVLVGSSLLAALAAANQVPVSRAGSSSVMIDANALKPTECAALSLTRLVVLSRGDVPSAQSELVIGMVGPDTISAGKGNDCILGGGGDDNLSGDQGDDVLLGGPGNDTLDGGNPGYDICYSGNGNNKKCDEDHP